MKWVKSYLIFLLTIFGLLSCLAGAAVDFLPLPMFSETDGEQKYEERIVEVEKPKSSTAELKLKPKGQGLLSSIPQEARYAQLFCKQLTRVWAASGSKSVPFFILYCSLRLDCYPPPTKQLLFGFRKSIIQVFSF